jgi:hypothetical protein
VIKFCKNEDGRIAIGTGVRPIEYCRPCHIAAHQDEFQQWKVVIPWQEMGIDREALSIVCAKTGEDIYEGGTVWLDPVDTNIPALVYSGFIEALPKAAAKAPQSTGA